MKTFYCVVATGLLLLAGCASGGAGETAPRSLPDVAFTRLGAGAAERPARVRDRVVVVNLWATWCEPCRDELPAFDALAREERSAAVFFAIDQAEDAKQVAKMVAALGIREMHVLLDPDQVYGAKFVTMGLPTTLVLDRTGKIRHRFYGAPGIAEVRAAIRKAART